MKSFHDGKITLHAGDCLDVLKTMPENSIGPMWTIDAAWMAYVCLRLGTNGARGLTDCEWIVPGTARSDVE